MVLIPEFSCFWVGVTATVGRITALGRYKAVNSIVVKAPSNNSDLIYIGAGADVQVPQAGVQSYTSFELKAGSEIEIPIDDAGKVFAVSATTTTTKQSIVLTDTAAGDTFKLTAEGETTAAIAYDADAAAVESALENLSAFGASDIVCTGGPLPGTPVVVEFAASYAGKQVDLTASEVGANEKQTVAIASDTTGGTFTLTYDSQTTAAIAFDATAADVKAALELLSNIDQVAVTGGPGPATDWVVEFQGSLARTDVGAMTGDGTNLTGGSTTDVTVTETQAGNAATATITQTQYPDAASRLCVIVK